MPQGPAGVSLTHLLPLPSRSFPPPLLGSHARVPALCRPRVWQRSEFEARVPPRAPGIFPIFFVKRLVSCWVLGRLESWRTQASHESP